MLPERDPANPIRRFGVFETNSVTGELTRNGLKQKLQDQPFRILAMLLDRPGELVTREELQTALWPEAEYGEFEQGLNTAVKKVRQALGDSADNPRFIETIPRKGYRFIAPVQTPPPLASSATVPLAEPEAEPQPAARRSFRFAAAAAALASIAAAAATGYLFWGSGSSARQPRPVAFATPVPVTSLRGFERGPAFSPDGKQIAFTWNGEHQGNFEIYVKELGSEKLTRLTNDPSHKFGPVWSPDGKQIAFARWKGIYLIPASGSGPEVRVASAETARGMVFHPHIAWSPDGKWLAFPDLCAPGQETSCLYLQSLETGERRVLTRPGPNDLGDSSPVFAEDGRTLAFLRRAAIARYELYWMPLGREYAPGGPPVRLRFPGDDKVNSLAWLPEQRRVVAAKPWLFGSSEGSGLWLVDPAAPENARSTLIPGAQNTSSQVAVSAATSEIAYSWNQSDLNIWHVRLDPARRIPDGKPQPLIDSTMDDIVPKFSPDGRRLVFISRRGGSDEVWVSGADGSNPLQLTKMGYTGSPSWSPDGSRIVFDSMQEGQYEVYTMLAAGGAVRRLTNNPASDGVASYSPDGQYIYFMSSRSGRTQVWRMRSDGSDPVQITQGGGYLAKASWDGKTLYYAKDRRLWKVPANGGEETQLPLPVTSSFLAFTVTRDSIYFIPDPAGPGSDTWVECFDLQTGKTHRVLNLDQTTSRHRFLLSPDTHTFFSHAGISVSPDGRTLSWAQADVSGSDIMTLRPIRPDSRNGPTPQQQ